MQRSPHCLCTYPAQAGALLDKSQNQAATMASKMQKLYAEIEDLALKMEHVAAKIAFISATGVDNGEMTPDVAEQGACGGTVRYFRRICELCSLFFFPNTFLFFFQPTSST